MVEAIPLLAIACVREPPVAPEPARVLVDVPRAEQTQTPAELWAELGTRRARATAAHRAQAWADAISGWRSTLELVPDHAGMRYNLACALARSGDATAALDQLEAIARMRIAMPIAQDPDLASLHADPRWARVVDTMSRAQEPGGVKHSRTAIELPGFHAEGIAWDSDGERLLLGGIVGQSLVAVRDAKVVPFATPAPTCSVFGVAIDPQRSRVWATCSAVAQGKVLPEPKGWAALLSFGFDGTPYDRLVLDDGREHLLGDLAIADDGVVYATDTVGGGVVAGKKGAAALDVVLAPGSLPSPQGIVALGDTLIVADYAVGLVRIADLRMTVLEPPPDTTLRGIDGLARHDDTLVAVQNGTMPARILRIDLAKQARAVERVTTLLVPDPADGEPTIASTSGDELRIMQTDRWDRVFDAEGRPRADVTIASPVVLRLPWPR